MSLEKASGDNARKHCPGLDIGYSFSKIFVVTDCHVNSINAAKRRLIKDGSGPVAVLQTIDSVR